MGRYSPGGGFLLIRRNTRLIVQLLSLAFLFAQLGMAVHASSHLKDTHATPTQLCGHCLSFAPLQNMAGGGATIILPVTVVHDHAVDSSAVAFAPPVEFSAFRSRAPPSPF